MIIIPTWPVILGFLETYWLMAQVILIYALGFVVFVSIPMITILTLVFIAKWLRRLIS